MKCRFGFDLASHASAQCIAMSISTFFSQNGWMTETFDKNQYHYLYIKPIDPSKHVLLLLHTYPVGEISLLQIIDNN